MRTDCPARAMYALSKKASTMPQFGVETDEQYFEKVVRPSYQDFLNNSADAGKAMLAIIASFHQYEWMTDGEKFELGSFRERFRDQEGVAKALDLARNLANGAKHAKLRNGVSTRQQTGFSPAFGDQFARPLVVIDSEGTEISVNTLLGTLIGFWEMQFANRRA